MPKIDYPNVIEEDVAELEKLEKRHRYSRLFHRARMSRLLKSGECKNLSEAAEALGYQLASMPEVVRRLPTGR